MTKNPNLAIYYHRAAFSSVLSTFFVAINNRYFSTWLGLIVKLITKQLPKSLATAQCYTKLARNNIEYIRKHAPISLLCQELSVTSITKPSATPWSNIIHIAVIEPSNLLATDLTGHFPTISGRGYTYIIVCYIYNTNRIIVCLIKNRSTTKHIQVYKDIYRHLEKRGLHSGMHKMDNKYSQAL